MNRVHGTYWLQAAATLGVAVAFAGALMALSTHQPFFALINCFLLVVNILLFLLNGRVRRDFISRRNRSLG